MTHCNNHKEVVAENISGMLDNKKYDEKNQEYLEYLLSMNYQYNFSWFGRPIIQIPQDIYAIQEMVWQTKPDLIIETGVAHGGSIVFAASLMSQLDLMESLEKNEYKQEVLFKKKRHVVGIDVDIREHNKAAMEDHPLSGYWSLIEGSSLDYTVINKIQKIAKKFARVMVILDSNHTHEHVLGELRHYAPLVSNGCYLVVWDTGIEELSEKANQRVEQSRPWGKGNNPSTALTEYLNESESAKFNFYTDRGLRAKVGISAASNSFLVRAN